MSKDIKNVVQYSVKEVKRTLQSQWTLQSPFPPCPGACFSKVPVTFRARKAVCVCCVCIQDQSFNNFENNTMKLSVNEVKLTGLWARNCVTIQQLFILKSAFGPEKFSGSFAKRPPS